MARLSTNFAERTRRAEARWAAPFLALLASVLAWGCASPSSASLASKAQAWRAEMAEALSISDPLPDPAPQWHGRFEIDADVVAERVSYASQRGWRVPAILYLPRRRAGRIPAILIASGHGGDKRSWYASYAGLLYAHAGAAVLTFDPVGEGERNEAGRSGTRSHDGWLVTEDLGRRLAGQMIADLLQGVSYLATREEVDPARIAVAGFSLGAFDAALACALDARIHACLLSGGGNFDGPGGHWESSAPLCQGIAYRALRGLGDRPAALYALHASRGPTLILLGTNDEVVSVPLLGAVHLLDIQERTARILGSRRGLFEWALVPGAGHQPLFVTRPAALWLERQLDLPNWTEASVRSLPEVVVGSWARERGVPLGRLAAGDGRDAGTIAIDLSLPAVPPDRLAIFAPPEWERRKIELIWKPERGTP